MRDNLLVALTMELCTVPNIPLIDILQALTHDPDWGGNVSLPNYLIPIINHMVAAYGAEDDHPGVYEYEVVPRLAEWLALQILEREQFPDMPSVLAELWAIEESFFGKQRNRIPEYNSHSDLLNWVLKMWELHLLFHPEDDPAMLQDINSGKPTFNPTEVDTLNRQIPIMISHWGVDRLCTLFLSLSIQK